MRHFRFSLIVSALAVLSSASLADASLADKSDADQLYRSGIDQLEQGNPWAAQRLLKRAQAGFQNSGNLQGTKKALIGQSRVHSSLGQLLRACGLTVDALGITDPSLCEINGSQSISSLDSSKPEFEDIEGLIYLGSYLLQLGEIGKSRLVYQSVVDFSKAGEIDSFQREAAVLGLANTERFRVSQLYAKLEIGQDGEVADFVQREAAQIANNAFDSYELLGKSSVPSISVRARLNWLKLFQELQHWDKTNLRTNSELPQLYRLKKVQLGSYLGGFSHEQFDSLSSVESIYARLNFVEQQLEFQDAGDSVSEAFDVAQSAYQAAKAIQNLRGQSLALGRIGEIYQRNNQVPEAITVYRKALSLSRSINAWDNVYKWQWKLGLLYKDQGRHELALNHYHQAIESLEPVRDAVLPIDSELQFSFQSQIAPVYREYIALLFSDSDPSRVEIALDTYNKLQAAELQNYLRCGRLDTMDLADVEEAPPTLYVIDVGNQFEVVLRKADGTLLRHQPDTEAVNRHATTVLNYVDDIKAIHQDHLTSILPDQQELYRQLILPFKTHLPKNGTLNFVLDGSLQNIPMGMLHDGEDFIIETYSLSLLLKDQLRLPRKLNKSEFNSVAAGLSEVSPSMQKSKEIEDLDPLPQVKQELAQIGHTLKKSQELLDSSFTRTSLEQAIDRNYPILHIATHGQFSSDPDRTFIYAWDQEIKASELESMIADRSDFTGDSIELLVLSACETAKGDQRSALGIAGITVQAGARSTVASLWPAESESTAMLMTKFYEALRQGETKAESLRKAQQYLKNETEFSHPFYWSGFILSGSWL